MAKEDKKKKAESKVVLERTYIVPLRKAILLAPKYIKAKKAVNALKRFIAKNMKSDDVKLGGYLNLEIWKHGMKNPPTKIKVVAKKYDDGSVFVEKEGAPVDKPVEEKTPKKKEEKKEKAPETKQEAAKEIQKEEIKEMQQENPKLHHPQKEPTVSKYMMPEPSAPKAR